MPKRERRNWKAIATDLAKCAYFSLAYLDAKGGGQRMNLKTGAVAPWREDFFSALEKFGVVIDRKEYWRSKQKRAR